MGVKGSAFNGSLPCGKTISPHLVKESPVEEVVHRQENDLTKIMPVLTHHARDVGPYMTCAFLFR